MVNIILALLPTEMDMAAQCHRFESIKCHSCMSQTRSLPPPASSHPHPYLHSLHQFFSFKKSFECCFRKILSCICFVTAVPTKSSEPNSCRKCLRLRATHKSNCVACQTKMNTKRNILPGLEVLADSNRKRTLGAVECSEAFVNHLLHLDSSHSKHNKMEEGIELRSSCKINTPRRLGGTNSCELFLVTKIPYSQSLLAPHQPAIEMSPNSNISCPAAEQTKWVQTPRNACTSSQITHSTIPLNTGLWVTGNNSSAPLTITSQSHIRQQFSSPPLGEDYDSGDGDRPTLINSSLERKMTARLSETCSDTKSSPNTDLSFSFFSVPSASLSFRKHKSGSPLQCKQTSSSFTPHCSVSSSTSSSFSSSLSHGRLEDGLKITLPKHAETDKHGYNNPAYQN